MVVGGELNTHESEVETQATATAAFLLPRFLEGILEFALERTHHLILSRELRFIFRLDLDLVWGVLGSHVAIDYWLRPFILSLLLNGGRFTGVV